MTSEERERRLRELAEQLADDLLADGPDGPRTVHEIEDLAEQAGRTVQREISERLLREEAARKEDGPRTACPCGGAGLYRGHYELTVVSLAGRVRVRRAYYYCDRCRQGHCPADTRLGLGPANTTPAAQARLSVLAAFAPYVQVPDLVAQLGLPLEVDLKSTERIAQGVGTRLSTVPLRPHGPAERTVSVGFDGVMYLTRAGYREGRVGVIYEPHWEAGRTPAGEAGLRKEFFGTTGSRESLVQAVCERAVERAGGAVVAVVADASALDWVDLDRYLPNRVEILDFYHVMERVSELARAMYPEGTEAAAWQAAMKEELLTFGPRKLREAVEAWQPEGAAAQELKRVQAGYFERQQERMRYPEYLRRGYPIGSGAVEGACKHLVGDRFGASGMRWKPETADPLMQLRAALLTQPRLDLRPFTGRGVPAAA